MKKKSLLVLIVLILSLYITLLKIDPVIAQPNSQSYYYEENITVRLSANNDSLNEIRFQGTNLNITGINAPENLLFDEAFENATYALLNVVNEGYNFDAYGNTFLHQEDDGIIFTVAYVNLSQNEAEIKAQSAKEIFEDAFSITLYNSTATRKDNYHVFTFINDNPQFNEIFDMFWSDASNVTSGFAGLLNNTDLRYDIKVSDYAKVVMGFINKTRTINSTPTSLREVFFSTEYLEENAMDLSTGYYNFSLNEIFHHTGDISRYDPSNSSTIDVYLPTPLEPNLTQPDPNAYQSCLDISNGTIGFAYNTTIPSITSFNASFLFEKWPCLLVEKSGPTDDSYSRGETFEVEISITNIGTGNATEVIINDDGQWDGNLELSEGTPSNEWSLIEPNEVKTLTYELSVKDSASQGLSLLNYAIVNYNFTSSYTSTIVELNATSNTVVVPVEADFPSLITTKSVSKTVHPSGEEINMTITISNPSELDIDSNINISEYVPGLFDNSSISNNPHIINAASQYDDGAYWVNFTLDGLDDHSSKTLFYIFYPIDSGILYLEPSNVTYSYGGQSNTIQSNSLSNLVYPRLINDQFHHNIKIEADFDAKVNPEKTITVNVTITNFGISSEQYSIVNRDPYRMKTQQYLNQTFGDNNFTLTLEPGESYAYNYSYYIPDEQGADFLYAPILVVSNVSTSIDPVIALSNVEDIHINRKPRVDSVSFNATKIDRVKETVVIKAKCSDHETPRAQLTVGLRINDSAGNFYNRSMTFNETSNLFVGNFTPSASARTGTHTFRIFVTDQHGLTRYSSYYNFTVKNTKPRVEWMILYDTNVTVGTTIEGSLGVKELETSLFNLNISLYCQSQNVNVGYYGTLSLFESHLVDQYNRVGTFDIEIDTSNWHEGTYDVYLIIEDDVSSINYYYGEITVRRDDSPFYANPDLLFGLAYNIGVVLFLIFQFRGLTLLIKREFPF